MHRLAHAARQTGRDGPRHQVHTAACGVADHQGNGFPRIVLRPGCHAGQGQHMHWNNGPDLLQNHRVHGV